jgi:hypothetical protein
MALDKAELAALVATVPEQAQVYAADLAVAATVDSTTQAKPAEVAAARTPEEQALDGVAHHVFNTLRGAEDTVDGATFEDIRSIVAEGGF